MQCFQFENSAIECNAIVTHNHLVLGLVNTNRTLVLSKIVTYRLLYVVYCRALDPALVLKTSFFSFHHESH